MFDGINGFFRYWLIFILDIGNFVLYVIVRVYFYSDLYSDLYEFRFRNIIYKIFFYNNIWFVCINLRK